MLKGSLVAIATPMQADGSLDEAALHALVDWHISEGTHGIVVVGTTGESPTVDFDEHCRRIEADDAANTSAGAGNAFGGREEKKQAKKKTKN